MNFVTMCGRLTKDVELRQTNSGVSVASFAIAVDRRTMNAEGRREADFFDCVAWRQTAEFIKNYFGKGRKILLTGSLQNRDYTAQDGTKRRITEIIVDQVEFADSRQDAQGIQLDQQQKPAPAQFTEVTDDDPEDSLPF